MEVVNIHEAKTHLSRLLERVARGESFVIARAGRPVARVSGVDAPAPDKQRRVGFLQGEIEVPDDFDRMGEDAITGMFEHGDDSSA